MKEQSQTKTGVLFETFNIHDKVEELNLRDFDDKNIIIAVPTYDESGRQIEFDDRPLFARQREDAFTLARYIMTIGEGKYLRMLTNVDEVDDYVDEAPEPTDVLVLLHEFLDFEKSQIVEALTESNPKLKVIELA